MVHDPSEKVYNLKPIECDTNKCPKTDVEEDLVSPEAKGMGPCGEQIIRRMSAQEQKDDPRLNLSFCGCGFLGIYHVGVATAFHQYAPQLSNHKVAGSSAGALVATSYICGNLQLAYAITDFLSVAKDARSRSLGPLHPSFDINACVREALERGLPEDVHVLASGRLHVSLTRFQDGEFKNVIVSQFESKEDVIQVLLCSCFIPFWSGLVWPKYKGISYIDGGLSNNSLILDDKTVTVSPFVGEADICPTDDTFSLIQINLSNTSFSLSANNLYRLILALKPSPPEVLSSLFEQGFADGIEYLQRMNLISCTKCLEIRSSLLVSTNGEDMEEAFTNEVTESINDINHHHIRLEQQEQKIIEISGNKRRDSVVSTTSSIFQSQTIHRSQSGWLLFNQGNQEINSQYDCDQCVLMRQKALRDPLPKQATDRIREACDSVNKSLSNWIYSHRPIKYMSYLAAPYYLPLDFSIALVYRCWRMLPFVRSELTDAINKLAVFLFDIIKGMNNDSTSSLLLESASVWESNTIEYEIQMIKMQSSTTTNKKTTTTTIRNSISESGGYKNKSTTDKIIHNDEMVIYNCNNKLENKLNHNHNHSHNHNHNHNTQHQGMRHNSSFVVGNSNNNNNNSHNHSHHHNNHIARNHQDCACSHNNNNNLNHQNQNQNYSPSSSQSSAKDCQSGYSVKITSDGVCVCKLPNSRSSSASQLHSLEDTFDSIVDVTSNQDDRIMAYYYRDAKNRLQVTEIFDHQRSASRLASGNSSSAHQIASSASQSSQST